MSQLLHFFTFMDLHRRFPNYLFHIIPMSPIWWPLSPEENTGHVIISSILSSLGFTKWEKYKIGGPQTFFLPEIVHNVFCAPD